MTRHVATEDELDEARSRIIAGSNIPPEHVSVSLQGSVIILSDDDPDGIIRANYVEHIRIWYIQHLWGRSRSWLPLIKAIAEELAHRGHGDSAVRWPNLDGRPRLATVVKDRLPARWVWDDEMQTEMWEITPNEALSFLSGVVISP